MKYLLLFLFCPLLSFAQERVYPQQYFRNPLGIPIRLAGNFGECRPGHFHSGLDIKTDGKENYPVFAAAAGYVSRIKMEPGGFGHAIYITHPNGFTTLYAHLNDFFPELQKFVHRKQYESKSWQLDLPLDSASFPVKKGQQIAWSGNTGGSSAPHLHFEIRETKTEHPVNPQLFGFAIQDKIPPRPIALSIYDADRSVYNQQAKTESLVEKKNMYSTIRDTILCPANRIHIGIAVNDYMDGSANTLSVLKIEWFVDDVPTGRVFFDDIGYEETRYLYACADYSLKEDKGIWFNQLFLLPNNRLKKLFRFQGSDFISLKENECTSVRIVLTDASQNSSTVYFLVRQSSLLPLAACDADMIRAGQLYSFANPNLRFSLGPEAVYDDICTSVTATRSGSGVLSSVWQIGRTNIPMHTYNEISIRPEQKIPFACMDKVVMISGEGKRQKGRTCTMAEGFCTASVREFGAFRLEVDTTAPLIKPLQKNGIVVSAKQKIRFEVRDRQTAVRSCEASINGQWICLEQHGTTWFYTPDEYCPKGMNKLLLKAKDESGNESRLTFTFLRH